MPKNVRVILSATDKASSVVRGFNRNLRSLTGPLAGLGALAGTLGVISLGRHLAGGFREVVRVGKEFEKTMSTVRALVRPTGKDFKELGDLAKEMGRKTVFTAAEAASAMEEFGQAGFTTRQILGALPDTLNLAAAGELTMAEAANLAATSVKAMGRSVNDLREITNSFAVTATQSNQKMRQLAEAFTIAAPGARVLGVELNEGNALLAFAADRGIKASVAGTALRGVFAILSGQMKDGAAGLKGYNVQLTDSRGKMLAFGDVIDNMLAAGIRAQDAFKIFGRRPGQVMALLLKEGGEPLRKFTDLIIELGDEADRLRIEKLANLEGDLRLLTSAFDGLKIAIFEGLSPVLRAATQELTLMISAIDIAPEKIAAMITGISSVASVLLKLSAVVNSITQPLTHLNIQIDVIKATSAKAGEALQRLGDRIAAAEKAAEGPGLSGLGKALLSGFEKGERLTKKAIERLQQEMGETEFDLRFPLQGPGLESAAAGIETVNAVLEQFFKNQEEARQKTVDFLGAFETGNLTLDETVLLLKAAVDALPLLAKALPISEVEEFAQKLSLLQPVLAPGTLDNLFSDLPEFGTILEFNIETGKIEKVNSMMASTVAFMREIGEASIKRNLVEVQITRSVAEQVKLGEDLLSAWSSINQDFGNSPDLLAAMRDQILLSAKSVKEGINPELDLLIERLLLAKEAMEGLEPQVISTGRAITAWVTDAAAFNEELAKGNVILEDLGNAISFTFRDQGVNAALAMGDAMVNAAFSAKIAWDDFLKGLIRNMIAAIVRMLILTAIGRAIGGAFGGVAGAQAGGILATAGGDVFLPAIPGITSQPQPGGGIASVGDLPAAPGIPGIDPAALITVNLFADGAMFLDEGMPTRIVRQLQGAIQNGQDRGAVS